MPHLDLKTAYDRLYQDLRVRARAILRKERFQRTLTATALANEVFCRFRALKNLRPWKSERHFLLDAIRAIRQTLIDRARARNTLKRGLHYRRVDAIDLDQLPDSASGYGNSRGLMEGPLQRLEAEHPHLMPMLDLWVIQGLSPQEIKQRTGRSKRRIKREALLIRVYLADYLRQEGYDFGLKPEALSPSEEFVAQTP